jgi:hypothetical protein
LRIGLFDFYLCVAAIQLIRAYGMDTFVFQQIGDRYNSKIDINTKDPAGRLSVYAVAIAVFPLHEHLAAIELAGPAAQGMRGRV